MSFYCVKCGQKKYDHEYHDDGTCDFCYEEPIEATMEPNKPVHEITLTTYRGLDCCIMIQTTDPTQAMQCFVKHVLTEGTNQLAAGLVISDYMNAATVQHVVWTIDGKLHRSAVLMGPKYEEILQSGDHTPAQKEEVRKLKDFIEGRAATEERLRNPTENNTYIFLVNQLEAMAERGESTSQQWRYLLDVHTTPPMNSVLRAQLIKANTTWGRPESDILEYTWQFIKQNIPAPEPAFSEYFHNGFTDPQ